MSPGARLPCQAGGAHDRAAVAAFARLCEQVEQGGLLEGAAAALVHRQDPRRPHRLAGASVVGVELDLIDLPANAVVGDVGGQLAVALKGLDSGIDDLGDHTAEVLKAGFHCGRTCGAGPDFEHRPQVGCRLVVVSGTRLHPTSEILASRLLGHGPILLPRNPQTAITRSALGCASRRARTIGPVVSLRRVSG